MQEKNIAKRDYGQRKYLESYYNELYIIKYLNKYKYLYDIISLYHSHNTHPPVREAKNGSIPVHYGSI